MLVKIFKRHQRKYSGEDGMLEKLINSGEMDFLMCVHFRYSLNNNNK